MALITINGERVAFEEHQKHCHGCHFDKLQKSWQNHQLHECMTKTADGISLAQRKRFREACAGHSLAYYCPDKNYIWTGRGVEGTSTAISRKAYLALKQLQKKNKTGREAKFTDNDIREYFGIGQTEFKEFKRRNFPDWSETIDIEQTNGQVVSVTNAEEITQSQEAVEALEEYYDTHPYAFLGHDEAER